LATDTTNRLAEDLVHRTSKLVGVLITYLRTIRYATKLSFQGIFTIIARW